jgi:hypothetical protein
VEATLAAVSDTVTSYCEAAQACCTAGSTPSAVSDCAAMYASHQEAIPGIKTGAVTVDMAALDRCKAAYADGPDQCNLNAVVAACDGVYVGHQGVGEPCFGVYDCDRSTGAMTCVFPGNASMDEPLGTCQKTPHAGLGEPCLSTCQTRDSDCSTNLLGGTLDDLATCFEEDGLYCQYLETGSICAAIPDVGQSCDGGSYGSCGSTAQCDTTCRALSDRGLPCGYGCYPQYSCIDGTCVDPAWDGDSACMGYGPGP